MAQGMWQNSPSALHVCQRCCPPWKRRTLGLNASGSVGATWAEERRGRDGTSRRCRRCSAQIWSPGIRQVDAGCGASPPVGPQQAGGGAWPPGPGVKGRERQRLRSWCTRAPGSMRGVCPARGGRAEAVPPHTPRARPGVPSFPEGNALGKRPVPGPGQGNARRRGPPEVPAGCWGEGLCPGGVGRRGPARGHRGGPSCAPGGVLQSRRPGHKACARLFTG